MRRPLIQVLLDDTKMAPMVRSALAAVRADVETVSFRRELPRLAGRRADARLVLTSDAASMTNGKCRQLLAWFDRDPCATLVVSRDLPDGFTASGVATEGRAIGFTAAVSVEALAGRLAAMCQLRDMLDAMGREIATLKRREQQRQAMLDCTDRDVDNAGRLQRALLPAASTREKGLSIDSLYRPAEAVSGDAYDICRIDAAHVAVTVVDATGHGMAAALLSNRAICTLRTCVADHRSGDMPYDPGTALRRLNRDLLAAGLPDCQFVAVIHAVFNERTGVIRWARGGAPYPILMRKGRLPQRIKQGGPLVGVCDDTMFDTVEMALQPGDRLLFHTDGLDAWLAPEGAVDSNTTRGRYNHAACMSDWFRLLATRPVRECFDDLDAALQADRLSGAGRRVATPAPIDTDDVTIVSLHLTDTSTGRTAGAPCPKRVVASQPRKAQAGPLSVPEPMFSGALHPHA